jgi:hypothetical protein
MTGQVAGLLAEAAFCAAWVCVASRRAKVRRNRARRTVVPRA